MTTATPSALGIAAADYAENGFKVFPCKPRSKEPWTEHGCKDASDTEVKIFSWWKKRPNANIGLATGDGIVVIDIDGDAGECTLAELEAAHGPLPETVSVRTGRGRHFFFKTPRDFRNSVGKTDAGLGLGIDVRGAGGYVVVPPSIHPNGSDYRWEAGRDLINHEPAPLPSWLFALLSAKGVRGGRSDSVAAQASASSSEGAARYAWAALQRETEAVASTQEGARNERLNSAAFSIGQLVGSGDLEESHARRELEAAGSAAGLPADEVRRTVASGLNAGMQQPRSAPRGKANGAAFAPNASQRNRGLDARTNRAPKLPDLMEPTPLQREQPPAAPYPVDALGPLREVAEAVHDMTQAPMALCALAVLPVAALAAQAFADVELPHGAQAPVSLFTLVSAESGERKSAADSLALGAFREFERGLAREYADEHQAFKNRHDAWEAQREELLKAKKKRGEDIEGALDALGPEPKAPLSPLILASDPTVEGLVRQLALSRPSLGVFSAEGGSFLGGHGMSEDHRLKTVATLSKFWDGTPIDRVRAGDGAGLYVGRRLSMSLMVQPIVAAPLLADPIANQQGFLARFLIAAPESRIGTRLRLGYDPKSKITMKAFHRRVGGLLCRTMPLAEGSRNELELPVLRLADDARELAQAYYLETEKAQAPGGALETVRPFASKTVEQACRIAAVLAIYENPNAPNIGAEAMTNAIALARWHLHEAERLAGAAVVSVRAKDAERMLAWLHQKWPETHISAGIAAQSCPSAFRETAKVRELFGVLQEHGWLIPAPGAKVAGKVRKEAWLVVRDGEGL